MLHRRHVIGVVVIAWLCVGATAATEAPDPAVVFASHRAVAERFLAETHATGYAVAASVGGALVGEAGFGLADVENGVPVDAGTRFRVASVSKTLTSAAIGQLVESGQLDIDVPIQHYVPTFPRKQYDLTLRQLAGHLAGIRHYRNDEFLSMRHYPDVLSGLAIFASDSLLFEPGTRYSYSTYGWNLISAALETASGRPFLQLMQENVFDRAAMHTVVPERQRRLIPHRARFYEVSENGTVTNAPYVDNSYKWAGGGFLSTAADLVRFGNAMLHGELVTEETFRWLITSQKTTDGTPTAYGIGWRTDMTALVARGLRAVDAEQAQWAETTLSGTTVVGHTGGAVGGRAVLLVAPEKDLVVAAFTNCNLRPSIALLLLADLVAAERDAPEPADAR